MLRISNLSVSYGKIRALDHVSLEVNKGETVAIVGSNGAGKTTLMWTISGGLKPTTGDIFLGPRRVPPVLHIATKMGIAICPERRRLFPNLTVVENLRMGAYLRNDKKGIKKDENFIYDLFPRIRERKKQYAGTLSGGEQQMVAIARALMARPEFILMDEPSLGLSPLLTSEVFKIIKQIGDSGQSILLVEQNVLKALEIANRAYVLETGRIVMSGKSSEIMVSEKVKKAYLGAY
jgi:branched-chain amino acid transport system ATP-binding protein